jgi:hypothetical protein
VKFISNVNRTYDDQYVQAGAKVGNTVNARLPQRFTATDGQALQLQNLFDQTVPITLTNQKNVAFGYSSQQATTELDDIRAATCSPAPNRSPTRPMCSRGRRSTATSTRASARSGRPPRRP